MKKKLLKTLLVVGAAIILASCGGDNGGESEKKGTITVDPLSVSELGQGFNAKFLPDKGSIDQQSGKIDVCLDFEGTQYGWKKVAAEYERLHGGAVRVNVNDNLSGGQYKERMIQELLNPNTDWDICEGNLGYGYTSDACVNMFTQFSAKNAYCGKDVIWNTVLDPAAYRSSVADTSGNAFIVNSEIMQSCWFINEVALSAAKAKGWANASGAEGYPETWDDLISLCEKMEEAGYSNPLGITLCASSVQSLQFTWLLRIYGDYYYRQFYKYTQAGDTWDNYLPTRPDIETLAGYGTKYCKILNLLFDENTEYGPGYVGFKSEVYKDFVSQLHKMKGHLMENVDTTEFQPLRDVFVSQSRGTSSPQIILDYQGFGLNYTKKVTDNFKVGYFDYPRMVSGEFQSGDYEGEKIVSEDTLTRDIGGNGGFISVINHRGDSAQTNLNKDFIKFFLSPYGQTIYYKGLAENNISPKGISSVKTSVVTPKEWTDFFNTSNRTIKFNGNVDPNPFISFGVRYCNGMKNTESCIVENWRQLLMENVGTPLTVNSFSNKWADACFKDMKLLCEKYKWPTDLYLQPHYGM